MPPIYTPFTLNRKSLQANGLVAWWPSTGSRGGSLRDFSGKGLDGALEGGTQNPLWTSSQVGAVPYFDGDDDRFYLGSITSSNPLSLYGVPVATVFCRLFWPGTGDSWQRIIDKSTGGGAAGGWCVQVSPSSGVNSIHVAVDGTDRDISLDNGAKVNQWFDFAVTFGNVSPWSVYVDGVLFRNDPATATPFPSTTAQMRIGTWNHSTGREFIGRISDLRIYSRQLSPAEIWSLHDPATQWDLYEPVLPKLYWQLGIPQEIGTAVAATQPIYFSGYSPAQNIDDTQPVYFKGAANVIGNQPIYMAGEAAAVASQPIYMAGATLFPFTDDFTGANDAPWNSGKWLSEAS